MRHNETDAKGQKAPHRELDQPLIKAILSAVLSGDLGDDIDTLQQELLHCSYARVALGAERLGQICLSAITQTHSDSQLEAR